MPIQRTERFKHAYKKLPPEIQERVKKTLRLLVSNIRHPSLRVKKIQGTGNIWEARVSRSCRLTFQIEGETYILRNVGEHDHTLKNP